MVRAELSVLSAFLAVAEERSFTRAAKRLNMTTSGLSHAVRRLEQQIGLQLLARTTRSVSPTAAGEQLIQHLHPALADIRGTLAEISELQSRPVGRLRLVIPRFAAKTILAPKLGAFVRDYPDVVLEVTTDDSQHVDLASAGYDAGIHFGEFIAQDMVAVRVSPDIRPAIVGAPSYFATRPKPASPRDLVHHRCILFRHKGEGIYRWELDKEKHSLAVEVRGPLIVDDVDLVISAVLDGVGLAFLGDDHAAPYLASGALERVLEDWSPPFPGFFLYYPSRRQQPAALSALIDTLRM